jgi:hypothetical protein
MLVDQIGERFAEAGLVKRLVGIVHMLIDRGGDVRDILRSAHAPQDEVISDVAYDSTDAITNDLRVCLGLLDIHDTYSIEVQIGLQHSSFMTCAL